MLPLLTAPERLRSGVVGTVRPSATPMLDDAAPAETDAEVRHAARRRRPTPKRASRRGPARHLWGNYPQALSHLGFVNAAQALADAEARAATPR